MLAYTTFRDTTTTKDKVVTHGSTMARKSGSMQASMERQSRARFKVCLKSAKNLCLGHRFFDEIRQIHRFFDVFRQILQILCRNQARNSWHCLVRVGRLSPCSLADGNAPVGGHPGPEEIDHRGDDSQNNDGGN